MSSHATDRLSQRIKDSLIVAFPLEARKWIRDAGLNNADIANAVKEMWKDEFQKRLDYRILTPEFTAGLKRIFVLIEGFIRIDDTDYPITITATSVDEKEDGRLVEKTLTGRKLIVIVADNEVVTMYPTDGNKHEIEKQAEEHDIRKARSTKHKVFESEPFIVELKPDGTLTEYTGRTGSSNVLAKAEKEYALSPGRKLKVYLKFMNGMAEAKVLEVLNRNSARADGFVKVAIELEDGRKVPKTLYPGDPVSVPTKDGGWEQLQVTDSLFVDYAHRGGAFSLKLI